MLPSTKPTPDESPDFFRKFWLADTYYAPIAKHPLSHTFPYLEDWQEKARTEPPFVHEESGTLLGADSGLPWMVRVLILVLLNLAVAKGSVEPPVPNSAKHDLSRLPTGEYDRVLGWCGQWLARINASSAILDQTFEARTSEELSMSASEFAACAQEDEEEQSIEQASLDREMEEEENRAAEPRKRKTKNPAKLTKGKTAKRSKGKKKAKTQDTDAVEEEIIIPEEESSDGEEDYEARDQSGSEMSELHNPDDEDWDDVADWLHEEEKMDARVKRESLVMIFRSQSLKMLHVFYYI